MNEILNLPVNHGHTIITLKEYLKMLLVTVWQEKEQFNGKRPFGNSDWEYDAYDTLVRHKLVRGTIDENGDVTEVDITAANKLVEEAINAIFEQNKFSSSAK